MILLFFVFNLIENSRNFFELLICNQIMTEIPIPKITPPLVPESEVRLMNDPSCLEKV